MSVQGLDAETTADAYQTALTFPGGWFLVHYVSREEVGLLDQGTNGFDGIKSALGRYPQKSPLYGFLSYHERNVLLKYIPEGTSRLLQARTSVHFQHITEHFVTHDIVLHFNALDEFTEAKLADSGADGSDTLSDMPNTLAQEVAGRTEDVVEVQSSNPKVSNILARLKAAKTTQAEITADDEDLLAEDTQITLSSGPLEGCRKTTSTAFSASNPELVEETDLTSLEEPKRTKHAAIYHSTSSIDARPGTRLSMDINLPPWKPKEKPFARPVTDDKLKKSQLAGFFRQRLPAGMRRGRKASEEKLASEIPRAKPTIGSMRENEQLIHTSFGMLSHQSSRQSSQRADGMYQSRPGTSRDLAHSLIRSAEMTASATRTSSIYGTSAVETQPIMTPERQRLMRALSLRRKQLDALRGSQGIVKPMTESEFDDLPYTGKTSNVDSGIDVGDTSESEDVSPVLHDVPPQIAIASYLHDNTNSTTHYHNVAHSHEREKLHDATGDNERDEAPLNRSELRSSRLRRSGISRARSTKDNGEELYGGHSRSQRHSQGCSAKGLGKDNITDDGYDSSSSNESLLEEMQGAVLEEARRISIPSSPAIKTGFFIDGSPSPYSITSIVIQTGSNRSRTTSGANSASASYPFPQKAIAAMINNTSSSRRANASSSISKRIHALNEASSAEQTHATMKSDLPTTPLPLGRSLAQYSENTLQSALARGASSTSPSRGPEARQSSRPQSASMTANIVPPRLYITGRESMDLQRSNVRIQQHIPEDGPSMTFSGAERTERSQSVFLPRPASRRSSFAFPSRKSIDFSDGVQNNRGSFSKPMSSAEGAASRMSIDHTDETIDPKKQKRTARMFKRLSSTFSISPHHATVETREHCAKEEIKPQSEELVLNRAVPSMVAIGELDVQFPDSLLWKRRWVETNGAGSLILSATRVSERMTNIPKSYHLSQFRTPLIPSHDRQEMPCSVLLEFHHGGTIQFACGDPVSQAQVLQWLLESHRQWA